MPDTGGLPLSFVIPTRNEADNVRPLLDNICQAVPGPEKELIFVDDSDDDTPLVLQTALAEADCPGRVLRRGALNRSGGLATAVVRGFQMARGEYVCTMDADLQHPASAVPLMLSAARDSEADIVIASRYLQGDRPRGFDGRGRLMVSVVAKRVVSRVLPASRATTDPLSGFFIVRRSVVDGIEFRPVGYKVLLEILVRGRWAKVQDVPYAFHSRNAGVSKATMREGLKFALHMMLLRQATPLPLAPPIAEPGAESLNDLFDAPTSSNGNSVETHDEIWSKGYEEAGVER